MTNAIGSAMHQRTEMGIDPNRDFPFDQIPKACMQTVAARTVNELYRSHLLQLVITFHGGMQVWVVPRCSCLNSTSAAPCRCSHIYAPRAFAARLEAIPQRLEAIPQRLRTLGRKQRLLTQGAAASDAIGYNWGAFPYFRSQSRHSPDDNAMRDISAVMSRFAGGGGTLDIVPRTPATPFPGTASELSLCPAATGSGHVQNNRQYPYATMNDLVYPVHGGMEDWGYAASWDTPNVKPCTPR
eukprot:scaffold42792_cov34-Tisochrysis_lutea.AAC.5